MNKMDKYLVSEDKQIDEGIFSSLKDDIVRTMRTQVTGKEQIRRVSNYFFNVWLSVISELKNTDSITVYKKLLDNMETDMKKTKSLIDKVTK